MVGTPTGIQRRWLHWAILSLLFVAEFIFFDRETSRHYAWVVPRWNDQVQYLTEVYRGYDTAHHHGLGAGLLATAKKPSAQGMALEVAGVAMLDLAGPSRSAALSLNMLAWIAVQLAFFVLLWRRTGRPSLAWLSVGLFLFWATPLRDVPGSAWDFRLDFAAACAFGVSLALALASEGFIRWLPSVLFGIAVGLTLLERFISGTYYLLIYAGLGVWVLCLPRRLVRVSALVLSGLIAAAIAGPIFWMNQGTIADYYYWGHYFGPESPIRHAQLGLGLWGSIHWVLVEVFGGHLKTGFWVCLLGLGVGIPWLRRGFGRARLAIDGTWWLPVALFFFAPFAVLGLHELKSFVVLSVMVPPAIAAVLGLAATLWPESGNETRACGVALAVLVGGIGYFVERQIAPLYPADYGRQAREVNSVAVEIARLSDRAKIETPKIAVDQITDYLDGQILNVVLYERQHRWRSLQMMLPTGIDSAPEREIMDRLKGSDFVFLHEDGQSGIYPYDRQLTDLHPTTAAWCDAHMVRVQEYEFFGRKWALYVRPQVAELR